MLGEKLRNQRFQEGDMRHAVVGAVQPVCRPGIVHCLAEDPNDEWPEPPTVSHGDHVERRTVAIVHVSEALAGIVIGKGGRLIDHHLPLCLVTEPSTNLDWPMCERSITKRNGNLSAWLCVRVLIGEDGNVVLVPPNANSGTFHSVVQERVVATLRLAIPHGLEGHPHSIVLQMFQLLRRTAKHQHRTLPALADRMENWQTAIQVVCVDDVPFGWNVLESTTDHSSDETLALFTPPPSIDTLPQCHSSRVCEGPQLRSALDRLVLHHLPAGMSPPFPKHHGLVDGQFPCRLVDPPHPG